MLGGQQESGLTDEQKQAVLMQMQQMVKGQQVQMKILGECFEKCVSVIGSELSDQDQKCIYKCTSRIFDTEQFLGNRLNAMLKQQQGLHWFGADYLTSNLSSLML